MNPIFQFIWEKNSYFYLFIYFLLRYDPDATPTLSMQELEEEDDEKTPPIHSDAEDFSNILEKNVEQKEEDVDGFISIRFLKGP